MELQGTIKKIFDEKHISEHFNTREFILITDEDTQYTQYLSIQLVNRNCDLIIGIKPGERVEVDVKLKGREWNGPQGVKYFNTIEACAINRISQK